MVFKGLYNAPTIRELVVQPIIECVDASEVETIARLFEFEREANHDAFDREGAGGEPPKDICEEWLGYDWELPRP